MILYHPIWFEGEYRKNSSVRSFEPWNSERDATFEKATYENLGRILNVIGIDLSEWREQWKGSGIAGLKVYAMETEDFAETEGILETPYIAPDIDVEGAMGLRRAIHMYYYKNLNLTGHDEEQRGFYIYRREQAEFVEHAHNMLIQIAYNHGIIVGTMFMSIYFCNL